MSEPTPSELNEQINEIKISIARIETKLDFTMEVKKTAELADKKADQAIHMAQENARDIAQLVAAIKWIVGLGLPAVISVVGLLISAFQ